ncbi:MAG TPA: hypothetical protein VGG39_23435 [Polyangiaceae bacterium]
MKGYVIAREMDGTKFYVQPMVVSTPIRWADNKKDATQYPSRSSAASAAAALAVALKADSVLDLEVRPA